MIHLDRRSLLKALALGSCAGYGMPLIGQTRHSVETLRVYVGIAPGGVSDTSARAVAAGMNGYATNAIVENRTGAGGQLAISAMRGKPVDGASCVVTPASMLTVYPHTYPSLPYDPFKDLVPVTKVGTFEFGFGVGPMVPASVRSMADFYAWCKKNPDKASFASPAAGSIPHFVGVLAGRAGGIDLVHVPYRGTQPAILDMIGGQIAAASGPVGGFVEHIKSGRCRLLASSGPRRSRFAPTVATYAEQGYPDIQFDEWLGIFMPSGTPAELIESANAALRTSIASPAVIKTLAGGGIDAMSSTPAELAALLKRDFERWQPIVKSIGFVNAT